MRRKFLCQCKSCSSEGSSDIYPFPFHSPIPWGNIVSSGGSTVSIPPFRFFRGAPGVLVNSGGQPVSIGEFTGWARIPTSTSKYSS